MAPKRLLVKRHGHMEEFDERKIYASVYHAALNAHFSDEDAESIADKVLTRVLKKMDEREAITSRQIKELVVAALGGPSNDIAYLYVHHLDIN